MAKAADDGAAKRKGASPYRAMGRQPGCDCPSKEPRVSQAYETQTDAVDDKVIDVDFCPGKKMVADILTKPIPRVQFEYFRSQLGLKSIM